MHCRVIHWRMKATESTVRTKQQQQKRKKKCTTKSSCDNKHWKLKLPEAAIVFVVSQTILRPVFFFFFNVFCVFISSLTVCSFFSCRFSRFVSLPTSSVYSPVPPYSTYSEIKYVCKTLLVKTNPSSGRSHCNGCQIHNCRSFDRTMVCTYLLWSIRNACS